MTFTPFGKHRIAGDRIGCGATTSFGPAHGRAEIKGHGAPAGAADIVRGPLT